MFTGRSIFYFDRLCFPNPSMSLHSNYNALLRVFSNLNEVLHHISSWVNRDAILPDEPSSSMDVSCELYCWSVTVTNHSDLRSLAWSWLKRSCVKKTQDSINYLSQWRKHLLVFILHRFHLKCNYAYVNIIYSEQAGSTAPLCAGTAAFGIDGGTML